VLSGSTYYYTLRALNANGNETEHRIVRVAVARDVTPPLPPRNVTVSGTPPTIVTVRWEPPESGDDLFYRVYRSQRSGETGHLIASGVTDTSWRDTLPTTATYHYTVTAVDASGNESERTLLGSVRGGKIPFIIPQANQTP
jgi:fibronectin type 3 domain-containing protein